GGVGASLCHALGLRRLTLEQSESMMQAESDKNLRTGFCSFEHNWYLVVADHLNRTAGLVYDGIGGDVFSAGLFLSPRRIELCEEGRLAAPAGDPVLVASDPGTATPPPPA